jgi:glutamine cyclotransferase
VYICCMENEQLQHGMAYVTFMNDGWEQNWYPLMLNGRQLTFDAEWCYEIARHLYPNQSWGIASTSQMLLNNAERNNL